MKWPLVKVGEIATQHRGVSYSKEESRDQPANGFMPIFRANNITDSGLTREDFVYVPDARVSEVQRVRVGDIVIAASSGSLDVVGKAAQATRNEEVAFGAFCKLVRPNSRVHPRYLGHFFKTAKYRQTVSSLAAGANINNLRNGHIDNLKLCLPPIEEQRRIAAILDQAEALRAKRRQALAKLDTLSQSLFLEMFGDPSENRHGWESMTLAEVITSGPQNGLYKPSTLYGLGTPILRIDAFYDGEISDPTRLKRVSLTDAEINLYLLRDNDIVVNRVNSREYLGKSALVSGLLEPTVFESNMMRFHVDESRVDTRYLIALLQTSYIKKQIMQRCKDAVNQSSINQDDVKSFVLRIPPLKLQQMFAFNTEHMRRSMRNQIESTRRIDMLTLSLQDRAFRGEL